ncbi:AAA family ATPase [Pectobacterium punjabense]|uniref:AAA family ATPase n=1 Tax=Pectobacterium punjabense TaxID=2108399 RepID=UPI0032EED5A1
MATLQKNILGAEAATRSACSAPLRKFSYDRRTCGTRDLDLSELISEKTGYWVTPSNISSKPPRWIVRIDATGGNLLVDLARNEEGEPMQGAGTVGYINNGQGRCALAAFRLMPSIKLNDKFYVFPREWEWIVQFAFGKPLPVGTSGDSLSDFSPERSEIGYKGRADAKSNMKIQQISLIMTLGSRQPFELPDGGLITYEDATDALQSWFSLGSAETYTYDPSDPDELIRIEVDLGRCFGSAICERKTDSPNIIPSPELFGISSEVYDLINASLQVGKRHFIFYGPPGTGKTTLAQYVAESIGEIEDDMGTPYTFLTGSSSWSSQDLVGGYQPLGPGKMGFIPGVMLQEFHKPVIIDELNRCSIDKVIGPLFSILSGHATSLQYRVNVEDPASPFYRLLPKASQSMAPHEFAPSLNWAMICTLNQVDKNQLEQVSLAMTRRFTWIRIGIPLDLHSFVHNMLVKLALLRAPYDDLLPNPVADAWRIVCGFRELGPAPTIDFLKLAAGMDNSIDFLTVPLPSTQRVFVAVFAATYIPLLDGIGEDEAVDMASALSVAWNLSEEATKEIENRLLDMAL